MADEPVILDVEFSRASLDPDAIAAVQRLQRQGHFTCLVGGGVRDLLLKRKPKDFDIATAAEPRQVKKLFRNARLIGRRFRIVHLHFGPKIVEVACFRRRVAPEDGSPREPLQAENDYGSPRDDALARDFTVNALFYDPLRHQVIDHVGGLEDLKARVLRTVGEPSVWFYEDPVRILRAAKFAGRLSLTLPDDMRRAMRERRDLLDICPKSRVNEEIFRIIESGHAAPSVRVLWETGVLESLISEIQAHLGDPSDVRPAADQFFSFLELADRLVRAHRGLPRPLLYTILLYLPALERLRTLPRPDADGPPPDWGTEVESWLRPRATAREIPRHFRATQRQLMSAIGRMLTPSRRFTRSLGRLVRSETFPEAMTLLRLHFRAFGEGEQAYTLLRRRADAVGASVAPEIRRRPGTAPPGRRTRRRRSTSRSPRPRRRRRT